MKVVHKKNFTVAYASNEAESTALASMPDWIRISETKFSSSGTTKRQALEQLEDAGFDIKESGGLSGLAGVRYIPASSRGGTLDILSPDNMHIAQMLAVRRVEQKLGTDISDYVMDKCGWKESELEKYLAAEQIDSVGMAIHNIEKKQAIIIADMAGIGKGRQGASIVKYAIQNGLFPVLITEKTGLFSDFYRDLCDTGQDKVRIAIINDSSDANIVQQQEDKSYKVVYEYRASKPAIKARRYSDFDLAVCTYSQFQRVNERTNFLYEAPNTVFILDEAHNAAGISSGTGAAIRLLIAQGNCSGAVFLSATYSKSIDSFFLYSARTPLGMFCDWGKDVVRFESFKDSIDRLGDSAVENISNMLAQSGHLIRRDREFKPEYITNLYLTEDEKTVGLFDTVSDVVKLCMMSVQKSVAPFIKSLNKDGGRDVTGGRGSNFKANCSPAFTRLFTTNRHLLACIKAEALAETAIQAVKDGYNVIVAYDATSESSINRAQSGGEDAGQDDDDEMPDEDLLLLDDGTEKGKQKSISGLSGASRNGSYSEKLLQVVRAVRMYTIRVAGVKDIQRREIPHNEFYQECKYYRAAYNIAMQIAKDGSVKSLPFSPIDAVRAKIAKAGIAFGEITGRQNMLDYSKCGKGDYRNAFLVPRDGEKDSTELYNQFNNNKLNLLIVNRKGATGKSAHAVATSLVPLSQVRPRKMIIGENELDVAIQIQKMGRIHRTGQVKEPSYLMVSSPIPSEARLFAMAERKLAKLSAATTANKDSDFKTGIFPDILNRNGQFVLDQLLASWTRERGTDSPQSKIMDVFDLVSDSPGDELSKPISSILIAVGLLPVEHQKIFYSELVSAYEAHMFTLKKKGDDDTSTPLLELDAVPQGEPSLQMGSDFTVDMPWGESVVSQLYEINNLYKTKPYDEVVELIKTAQSDAEYREAVERFKKRGLNIAEFNKTNAQKAYDNAMQKSLSDEEREKVIEKRDRTIRVANEDIEQFTQRAYSLLSIFPGTYIGYKTEEEAEFEYGFVLSIFVPKEIPDAIPSKCYLTVILNGQNGHTRIPLSRPEVIAVSSSFATNYAQYNSGIKKWSADSSEMFRKGWERTANTKDRVTANIYTGNIIRYLVGVLGRTEAFRDYITTLFTLADGSTKLGIMLKPGKRPRTGGNQSLAADTFKVDAKQAAILAGSHEREMRTSRIDQSESNEKQLRRAYSIVDDGDALKIYLQKSPDLSYMYIINSKYILACISHGVNTSKNEVFALKYGEYSRKARSKDRGIASVLFFSVSSFPALNDFISDYRKACGMDDTEPCLYIPLALAVKEGLYSESDTAANWKGGESSLMDKLKEDEEYYDRKLKEKAAKAVIVTDKDKGEFEDAEDVSGFVEAMLEIIYERPELVMVAMSYYEQGMTDEEVADRIFFEAVS